jgi:F0F1-type ATP synthase delta subunit
MKVILAIVIKKSLRVGLAIRYKARKIGKNIKRKVSEVKSIYTSKDLVGF